MTLSIDIISDVVCPWCYIGKRRLEATLALYRDGRPGANEPAVSWHPFQLNPNLPNEGVDRDEYVRRKFGRERGVQVYSRVAAVGKEVGIPFAFEKVVRQPNTIAAHSLIALAADSGRQDEMVEAFFRAYFVEGLNLTSAETLVEIATGAGLDAEEAKACLASGEARANIAAEDAEARSLGVEGVPFFIFNRRLAISGAHEPEVLLGAMLEAEKQSEAA